MQNPIGIFDSGVGGLSVLLEIQKLLPHESYIFVADQAFAPYGGKTQNELQDRVAHIMRFFEREHAKVVVVACNTATVYTVEEMRRRFKFPIIGTVPVVKTIANITKTGKTAVFSTPATAKSQYLDRLIEKFAKDINVERIGGSNLEQLVENGEINTHETKKVLSGILKPLVESGVDAIALGCTHYPFLSKEIRKIVGEHVAVVDSGGAVARRLRDVLQHEKLLSDQKGGILYYTTGEIEKFERVSSYLTGEKIRAEHITI